MRPSIAVFSIAMLVACMPVLDGQERAKATPTAARTARPPATEPRLPPIARATVTPKFAPTPTPDASLLRFAEAVRQLERDRDALDADVEEWVSRVESYASDAETAEYLRFVDRRRELTNALARTNPPAIARQAWNDMYEAYGQWSDAERLYYESLDTTDQSVAADFYRKYSNALREGNRYYQKGSEELFGLLGSNGVPCRQLDWCANATK